MLFHSNELLSPKVLDLDCCFSCENPTMTRVTLLCGRARALWRLLRLFIQALLDSVRTFGAPAKAFSTLYAKTYQALFAASYQDKTGHTQGTPANSLCLGPPFPSKHRTKPKHKDFWRGGVLRAPKFFMLKFFVRFICALNRGSSPRRNRHERF